MTTRRANPELVWLHWLMALMVLCALTAIVSRGLMPSGHPWRPVLRNTHLVTGQLIFVACLLRLVVRWRHPLPPLPGTRPLAVWAARGLHALLYVVMLLQPVTGLLFMQAGDKTVSLGGFTWPMLVASDAELHFQLKDLHAATGQMLYVLIGLHVAAALWHHHVRRDDTLRRMLPWKHRAAPAPEPAPAPQPLARPGDVAAQAIDGARQQAAAHPPPARQDEHDEVTP